MLSIAVVIVIIVLLTLFVLKCSNREAGSRRLDRESFEISGPNVVGNFPLVEPPKDYTLTLFATAESASTFIK